MHHLSILLKHQGCQITVQPLLRITLSSTHSTPTEYGQRAHKRCYGWMLLGTWDCTASKENPFLANDHWYFSVWREILVEALIEIKQQNFSSFICLYLHEFLVLQTQIFTINFNSMVSSNFKYSWFNKKKKDHWHLKHYSNTNLLHSPVQDCAEVFPSFLMKTEILISLRLKWLQDTAAYVHSYYHKEFSEGLKAWKNGSQLKLRGETVVVAAIWWWSDSRLISIPLVEKIKSAFQHM